MSVRIDQHKGRHALRKLRRENTSLYAGIALEPTVVPPGTENRVGLANQQATCNRREPSETTREALQNSDDIVRSATKVAANTNALTHGRSRPCKLVLRMGLLRSRWLRSVDHRRKCRNPSDW